MELWLLQSRPTSCALRTVAVTVMAVVRLGRFCPIVVSATTLVPNVRLMDSTLPPLLEDSAVE